jgi:tRNA dimethylallyltransferase
MTNTTNRVIVIAGPTGSGKTDVACELCRIIGGEIISADSRQVYKHLDVGTNKAGVWDEGRKARVYKDTVQHLTDIIEPSRSFNAGQFVELANDKTKSILDRGKIPVMTGGTGLYIKAFVDGLAPLPESDPQIRQRLCAELERDGIEHLYDRLKEVDPESALKNKNNPQRLLRALEVFEITGTPISVLHKMTTPSKYSFFQAGLLWDSRELYSNLDSRSLNMLGSGMIEETKNIIDKGCAPGSPGLEGIGYRDVIRFLNNLITRVELESAFKLDMRHYAKRQMTWFKKDYRVKWINLSNKTFNPVKIANDLANMIK